MYSNNRSLGDLLSLIEFNDEYPLLAINGIPAEEIKDSKESYTVDQFVKCYEVINEVIEERGIQTSIEFREEIADYFLKKYLSIEKSPDRFFYPKGRMRIFVIGYLKKKTYESGPWH